MTEALWLAIACLLVHASWRLSAVATKLDGLCDRMKECEASFKADINRVHERIDSVEESLRTTHTNMPPITTQKGARA
jgi:hypothetical protein